MDRAQVATCGYAPPGGHRVPTPSCGGYRWPPPTSPPTPRTATAHYSHRPTDPRPRRHIDQAYAVSFIVTNIPTYDNSDDGELITDIEHWFRHRTDIEERIRDAKHGAALRHLPSGKPELNTVWMWAALLAINISVLLQAVTGIDDHGRRHGPRLRAELICIPARRIHHGRTITWRLPSLTCSHGPGIIRKELPAWPDQPTHPCQQRDHESRPPERTSGTSACQHC